MAKLYGINSKLSGKIGDYVFLQTKKGTVVYEAPINTGEPRRSYKQMSTRTQWANLGATYKLFNDMLKHGFEGVPSNQTSYNAFVANNIGMVKVYITKKMRKNGGCVLAPYQITEGSLPRIVTGFTGDGILVTNIALGDLTVNASTTLADFSEAILANNKDWQEGDQLSFFHGTQTFDAVLGTPLASLDDYKMMIDTANPIPLWEVTGALGFTNVGGNLGMSTALVNGAAAWVHSRGTSEGGDLRVSTQFFIVENAALATYQSLNALMASTDSYGGINTQKVYLKPDEETNVVRGVAVQASAGSGSGTGGSSTGGNSGGSSTGSDSSTGSGQGGGSESHATVSAPTISGETPFEESTSVTMSGPADATIHYTLDGSTPTSASTAYTEALTLTDTTTVKAIAVKDNVSSSVASRTFTKGSGSGGGVQGED